MASGMQTCEFNIVGIERALEGKRGFSFTKADGLNLVLTGRAGAGKSIFALQMAFTARLRETKERFNALYLTKDTPPQTLIRYVVSEFALFMPDRMPQTSPEDPLEKIRLIPPFEGNVAAVPDEKKRLMELTLFESCVWRPTEPPSQSRDPKKPDDGPPTIIFLDHLITNAFSLFGASPVMAGDVIDRVLEGQKVGNDQSIRFPALAVADLNLASRPPAEFPRNAFDGPLLMILWHLCPGLKRAFEAIDQCDRWTENLMVVVDSLPLPLLEQCLRFQAERPRGPEPEGQSSHPFSVYISEVPEVPQEIQASYPPDVQIRLDVEQRNHSTQIKTLQVQKARFQRVRHEVFPFVVTGAETKVGHADLFDVQGICSTGGPRTAQNEPEAFEKWSRGITILPSMSDAATCRLPMPPRAIQDITFGTPDLDDMTREGNLAGGGCTLVVTGDRCHSTALGLHFLLGAIGQGLQQYDRDQHRQGRNANLGYPPADLFKGLPRSVLYITVDTDLLGALYDIWCYPLLRRALWAPDSEGGFNVQSAWRLVEEAALNVSRGHQRPSGQRRAWHRLYKIPLLHGQFTHVCDNPARPGPYLYVLVPDFTWCTPEEVLERIERILRFSSHKKDPTNKCAPLPPDAPPPPEGECLRVDRVLFNRAGQVESRWPMIKNVSVFLSSLAQMCQSHLVELMLLDDLEAESEQTNKVISHWIGVAQNIIRLRRVPFHSSEAVAMELVRSPGRHTSFHRPQELYLRHIPTQPVSTDDGDSHQQDRLRCRQSDSSNVKTSVSFHQQELCRRDAFRGYAGLFTGKPQHARVVVDLVYDRRNTPLYRDAQNTARNLRMLIEGIEVNVRGPDTRPGINSALSNLSSVSHDTCHVTAIDEVWIHRIIGNGTAASGLAELTGPELASALPIHIRQEVERAGGEGAVYAAVKRHYATEALTVACRKAGKKETVYCLPYWNNWGVLAVSRPRIDALRQLLNRVVAAVGKQVSSVEQVLAAPDELQMWGGQSARALAAVLLGNEEEIAKIPDDCNDQDDPSRLRQATQAIYNIIYHRGTAQKRDRENGAALTWRRMRAFKRLVWDQVAVSPRVKDMIAMLDSREKHRQHDVKGAAIEEFERWFGPRTTLYFFDCHRDSTQSPVCFFLELILTFSDISSLFRHCPDRTDGQDADLDRNYSTGSLLFFREDDTAQEAFVESLKFLYDLLSPAQRRELAPGVVRRERERSETPTDEKIATAARSAPEEAVQDSPDVRAESYALFSREWLSTVPDVRKNGDLRDRVVLRHLPAAGKESSRREADRLWKLMASSCTEAQANEASTRALSNGLGSQLRGVGATLSGTWYLGALSGGNLDLACDIIGEVVSAYHERDRVISGCAGPVTRESYKLINDEEDPEHFVPYAEIIDDLLEARGKKAERTEHIPTFPFCRGRIRGYTSISLELNELIRRAMLIEFSLVDAGGDQWGPEAEEQLRTLVRGTFRRISKLNSEYEQGRLID